MPRWMVRPVTLLMFKCAWLLGLNWAVILPADDDGRLVGVVMATSKEAYTEAFNRLERDRQK